MITLGLLIGGFVLCVIAWICMDWNSDVMAGLGLLGIMGVFVFPLILIGLSVTHYHTALDCQYGIEAKTEVLKEAKKLLGAKDIPAGLEATQLKAQIVRVRIELAELEAKKKTINYSKFYIFKVKEGGRDD